MSLNPLVDQVRNRKNKDKKKKENSSPISTLRHEKGAWKRKKKANWRKQHQKKEINQMVKQKKKKQDGRGEGTDRLIGFPRSFLLSCRST